MAVWSRNHKSKEEPSSKSDNDSVNLDDDEYAWWAARDELKRAWTPPKKKVAAAPEEKPSAFEKRYSSESLFSWASSPDPDDPTLGGGGVYLDPYAVLGLQPGATLDEVVAAHRRLAMEHHPDRQHGANDQERLLAEETMRRINGAYQELRTRTV